MNNATHPEAHRENAVVAQLTQQSWLVSDTIIDKLNRLLKAAAPRRDWATFFNCIAATVRENPVVMAQVENKYNTREVVVKHGSLPGAVEKAVAQIVLSRHSTHAALVNLATSVLKPGRQVMPVLTEVMYDLIRSQRNIDLDNEAI